jgi:hypothetical protein
MPTLTDIALTRRVYWRILCEPERCVHRKGLNEPVSPRRTRKRCRLCGTALGEMPRCPPVTASGRQCLLGEREDLGHSKCTAHRRERDAGRLQLAPCAGRTAIHALGAEQS